MKMGLLAIVVFFSSTSFGQKKFSHQEVLEDLEYLRNSLEEAHYNLFAYTTEAAFNQNFEVVKSSIGQDSLSLLEVTSLYQKVISKANNGHTEIWFPGSSYGDYAYAGGTLFPLELAFEDHKVLVRKNLSDNQEIKIGAELLSINKQPISEILDKIYPQISAERLYLKRAKIELFSFPRLYWQVYGKVADFEVQIRQDEQIQNYRLNSIPLIEGFEMKRNEVFSNTRELKFLDKAAYLKPGNFGGEEQKYQDFIDSSFSEINKNNLPFLIIDLRNNTGGDDSFSDYLVSYIADRPFKWHSEFTLKTSAILKQHVRENYDTTIAYWQRILDHEDGSIFPVAYEAYTPQTEEIRYSGKVYVLVNRQSHSQSAVTAAQIQDYGFATIVGEETGDFPSLYASRYSYKLPITGIEVMLSKGYIVRVNGSKKAEGVIPDIYIKDHLLDDKDEILEGLLKALN